MERQPPIEPLEPITTAIAEIREDLPEADCGECLDKMTVTCPECDGSRYETPTKQEWGWDDSFPEWCSECKGRGIVWCPDCEKVPGEEE